MKPVGICRFSLLGRGDWKAFRGKEQESVDQVSLEQAKILFAKERMEERLKSFEHLTLASLKGQTDKDFIFLVLSSSMMPEEYQAKLIKLCESVPQVHLRFFGITTAHEAQMTALNKMGIAYKDIIQFRLDDDDCISTKYIENLKSSAATMAGKHRAFALTPERVLYCTTGKSGSKQYDWNVKYFSAGLALHNPKRSVYQFGHFSIANHVESVVIPDCNTLALHNGTNDTTLTPASIAKRGMALLGESELEVIMNKYFPFIGADAKKVIGIKPEKPQTEDQPEASKSGAPNWLADLSNTQHTRGFYVAEDDFAIQHTYRGDEVLHVSFDNLSGPRSETRMRDSWGYDFAKRSNWSSLGVLSFKANWYRDTLLFDELHSLSRRGFFNKFGKVIFSGTSMGAYAACAFSSVAPGSTVVAFSPQSSLSKQIAHWDRRYPSGRRADWSGPFSDAAEEISVARKVWIVYDPNNPQDRMHAERMRGANVTLLRARYSSHFAAQFMRQIGVLSTFVRECTAETMTESRFYSMYRSGRLFQKYLDGVVSRCEKSNNIENKSRLLKLLETLEKPNLAKRIRKSIKA